MRKLTFAFALIVALLVIFAPGIKQAHADYTGYFTCDERSSTVCIYADGTYGDKVYGKYMHSGWVGEDTSVNGAYECSRNGTSSDYVQSTNYGGSENCPFTNHSYDDLYHGYEIVTIVANYNFLLGTSTDAVVQGTGTATGHLWVQLPAGTDKNYVNVYATDNDNRADFLCDHGDSQPLTLGPCTDASDSRLWNQF